MRSSMNLLKSLSAKSTSGNNIECTGNARKVECDRRCDAILLHLQNALRTMKHQGRILFRQPVVVERADAVEMPQTARALNPRLHVLLRVRTLLQLFFLPLFPLEGKRVGKLAVAVLAPNVLICNVMVEGMVRLDHLHASTTTMK